MALGGFMMGKPGGSTPNKNLANSTREGGFASGGGMSNGTTRNNTFGGQTARAEPGGIGGGGGGLASPSVSRGATLASERMVNRSAKGDRLQSVNTSAKGDMLQMVNTAAKSPRSITQVYGSRTAEIKAADSNTLTAMADRITATGVRGLDYSTPAYRAETASQYTAQAVRGVAPRATSAPKSSTGPVSRGMAGVVKTSTAPAMKTGVQDYKSIVPGKVTMTAEKVPFAQKNPSLAKYMGGTPAKPVNVSVDVAKKMAGTVAKTGAYISAADWAAQMGLPASALTKVGTKTPGYGTTTVKAGPATIGLSYPKSVATGKSFGTYTAGPKSSTGPVSRGVQSKASTGPVPRGVSPAPKSSTGPVSRGMQTSREVAKPTVQQVRVQSKENKAASVKSRIVKGGYVYNRVGDRLQNFTAATDKDINRMRRNQK